MFAEDLAANEDLRLERNKPLIHLFAITFPNKTNLLVLDLGR